MCVVRVSNIRCYLTFLAFMLHRGGNAARDVIKARRIVSYDRSMYNPVDPATDHQLTSPSYRPSCQRAADLHPRPEESVEYWTHSLSILTDWGTLFVVLFFQTLIILYWPVCKFLTTKYPCTHIEE